MKIPRINEAAWNESTRRWRVSVQRNGIRRAFYSSTPGETGKAIAERKADEWLENTDFPIPVHEPMELHGGSHTRLYRIWRGMQNRCYYPSHPRYKLYGKRKIRICAEWFQFSAFRDWALANGYTDNLSLDRIDNNGNYEPSNCRWVTPKEQARNTSWNLPVELVDPNGGVIGSWGSVAEASEATGTKSDGIYYRIRTNKINDDGTVWRRCDK